MEGHSGGPGGVSGGTIADAAHDQMRNREQGLRNTQAFQVNERVNYTLNTPSRRSRATVAGYPGRKNLIWLSSGFPIRLEPDSNFNEREWQTASDYTKSEQLMFHPGCCSTNCGVPGRRSRDDYAGNGYQHGQRRRREFLAARRDGVK